jgi:hypothetical protein
VGPVATRHSGRFEWPALLVILPLIHVTYQFANNVLKKSEFTGSSKMQVFQPSSVHCGGGANQQKYRALHLIGCFLSLMGQYVIPNSKVRALKFDPLGSCH